MGTFDLSQLDPAMLELFQAEMDTHIPALNQGLLALEKGQAGDREIEAMMRAAHSIKGAARIVGIEPAVRVSHTMEDCFTAAKNKSISLSSDTVDVLLQGVDALQRICSPQDDAPITDAAIQELLAQIAAVKDGNASIAPVKASPAIPAGASSSNLVAATVRRDEPSVTMPALFDDAAAVALRKELLDTLALQPVRIQVDFAHVEQLTAAALALLVSFARQAGRSDHPPVIEASGISAGVHSVLRAAGLSGAFGVSR